MKILREILGTSFAALTILLIVYSFEWWKVLISFAAMALLFDAGKKVKND